MSETDLEDMKKIGSTPKKIEDDTIPYRSFSRNYGKNFMHISRGLGKMDKESDEYKERVAKFYDLNAKYHKALDKIEPELNAMRNNFNAKWLMPEDEEELALCEFGEWVESGILALRFKKEEEKKDGRPTLLKQKNVVCFMTAQVNSPYSARNLKRNMEKCWRKREINSGIDILDGVKRQKKKKKK